MSNEEKVRSAAPSQKPVELRPLGDSSLAKHLNKPAAYLSQLRQRRPNRATDLMVTKDDDRHRVRIHSSVAAAHSRYIRSIIADNEPPLTICLDGLPIDWAAFLACVDFMYDGDVGVSKKNVKKIMVAAAVLQMDELQRIVDRRLLSFAVENEGINLLTVFDLSCRQPYRRCISESVRNHLLSSTASRFLRFNGFEQLSEEAILTLLSDQRLVVSEEMVVFEFAIRWIQNNRQKLTTADSAVRILDCVRFGLLRTAQKFQCYDAVGRLQGELSPAVVANLKGILNVRMSDADWLKTCVEVQRLDVAQPATDLPRKQGNYGPYEGRDRPLVDDKQQPKKPHDDGNDLEDDTDKENWEQDDETRKTDEISVGRVRQILKVEEEKPKVSRRHRRRHKMRFTADFQSIPRAA